MNKQSLYYIGLTVIFILGILSVIFFVEMLLNIHSLGYTLDKIKNIDYKTASDLARYIGGDYSRLLGIAFTTISIAVPLTANMYSVKFIEIFIKDRFNAAVLFLFAFSELHNAWLVYNIRPDYVPLDHLYLSLFLLLLDFSILIPYLFYIAKFLHPSTLLSRLEYSVIELLNKAANGKKIDIWMLEAELEHIANIAIRSIDRTDRDTALESIVAYKRIMKHYWTIKPKLDPAWFEVERNMFLGFSKSAIADLIKTRTWFEMKVYSKLRDIISAAVPRVHDIVSKISNTTKELGLEETSLKDPNCKELVVEYFNTYLRLAINRKDPRSVFTIIYQYRNYAEGINETDPAMVLEIAYYFEYYAQVAFDSGMPFIVETIAHDLVDLVKFAFENNAANKEKLLTRFIAYDNDIKSPTHIFGVKKAQAILLGFFMGNKFQYETDLLSKVFEKLDRDTLLKIQDDLMHIKKEKYWEVIDRRTNIDYVDDNQKEIINNFLKKCLETK